MKVRLSIELVNDKLCIYDVDGFVKQRFERGLASDKIFIPLDIPDEDGVIYFNKANITRIS